MNQTKGVFLFFCFATLTDVRCLADKKLVLQYVSSYYAQCEIFVEQFILECGNKFATAALTLHHNVHTLYYLFTQSEVKPNEKVYIK